MSRSDLQSSVFAALDADRDRRLDSRELRRFAELTGFEGSEQEWQEEFSMLCDAQGCDLPTFAQLLDDEDGLYMDDAELRDLLHQLPCSASGRRTMAAVPVGLEYFQRERAAGLYDDGEWKAWDPTEGTAARSPRRGTVEELQGCSGTLQEAIMFVNEQVQNGIFGEQSGLAQARLGELMAAQGAGWFEFRIDENAMDEDELAQLVLAPDGWQVDRSTIPEGYMMHIMSVGRGVRATLCGREGLPIVHALHRDVSKCKRLCDTGLCGVLGRKRVILLAPDVFPASSTKLRSPEMSCELLQPLQGMGEEEAWQSLEAIAKRPGQGGVIDLEPRNFVFVPHGWWHAVRPIDDFTFITGPSQLSRLGVQLA